MQYSNVEYFLFQVQNPRDLATVNLWMCILVNIWRLNFLPATVFADAYCTEHRIICIANDATFLFSLKQFYSDSYKTRYDWLYLKSRQYKTVSLSCLRSTQKAMCYLIAKSRRYMKVQTTQFI